MLIKGTHLRGHSPFYFTIKKENTELSYLFNKNLSFYIEIDNKKENDMMTFDEYVKCYMETCDIIGMNESNIHYKYWLRYRSPESKIGLDRLLKEFDLIRSKHRNIKKTE